MPVSRGIALSEATLQGLFFIHRYRFLTIAQFARVTGLSNYHAAELLRRLEKLGALGYFGGVFLPGSGKTPKVYFLKRRGFEPLSGCIPRSLLRASGLLPCCPNTPQLAAGIFYCAEVVRADGHLKSIGGVIVE